MFLRCFWTFGPNSVSNEVSHHKATMRARNCDDHISTIVRNKERKEECDMKGKEGKRRGR